MPKCWGRTDTPLRAGDFESTKENDANKEKIIASEDSQSPVYKEITDQGLNRLIQIWDQLSPKTRNAILALIEEEISSKNPGNFISLASSEAFG
jgi:hypothetical protein